MNMRWQNKKTEVKMESFTIFIIASIALIVTPGPHIIYVLIRGIADGKLSGAISAIDVTTGVLI